MPTTKKTSNKTQDRQAEIVAEIVKQIEAGAGEFKMPWAVIADVMTPVNALTNKAYRGGNAMWLAMVAAATGYETGYWATYKQWAELGAQVRKGETSTFGVKWSVVRDRKALATDPESEKTRMVPFGFSVFNAAQVDGWTPPVKELPNREERLAECDRFFSEIGAEVRYGGGRAFYRLSGDFIGCPEFGAFEDASAFYSTLAHEHIHWTGSSKRLDRTFGKRFGDETYAAEELVAELGAAFLCAHLGISQAPRPDHASYLASWLRTLKAEPSTLFTAASKAQAAVDFLIQAAGAIVSCNKRYSGRHNTLTPEQEAAVNLSKVELRQDLAAAESEARRNMAATTMNLRHGGSIPRTPAVWSLAIPVTEATCV